MSGASRELFAAAIRLEDAGQPKEALERYAELLRQVPNHADAWHNRGLLLARVGRLAEAEESHQAYVRASPDDARARSDLADVLVALERYDEALAHAARAVELNKASFLPAFTAGLACSLLRRFGEASEWFGRAQRTDPAGFARFVGQRMAGTGLDRDLDPRAIYLIREFDRLQCCDWSRRDEYIATFAALVQEGVAAPPLVLRSLALPLPLAVRRRLADNASALIARQVVSSANTRPSGSRIRLGYVSPDFRTHPTGMLSAPLFRLHDRARFEVHAFSLSQGDDSHWRREVERHADGFHSIGDIPRAKAVSVIQAMGIDVLVDLAGATTGAVPEIFAARPAPVRVSYLGFPGGTGSRLVDYLICDPVCVPAAESAGYSEALARLPTTWWICEPQAEPAARASRAACGLQGGAVVLYAHHPGQKIQPEVFSAWMDVLRGAPRAVLWLLHDAPAMRENLLREAASRGIGAQRLVFAPRAPLPDYRARIPLADLALDTPVYNGGATTLDALLAGIPVLTCTSQGFAGRMAASALCAAGLADLMHGDLASYTAAAIRLASGGGHLTKLRERVKAARQSALFDATARTWELERAFERMHELAAAGRPPASFDL